MVCDERRKVILLNDVSVCVEIDNDYCSCLDQFESIVVFVFV